MSGRRWIIVDERVSREASRRGIEPRYYSRGGWEFRVSDAVKFYSWDEALAEVISARDAGTSIAIVPMRSEVTSRARAAAQAAEDDVATMRAELDGLRATDEEMAAKLARWQLRAEIAETAYDGLRTEFESARHALGATGAESVNAAAMRVAGERDEAVRELGELRRAVEVLIARVGG